MYRYAVVHGLRVTAEKVAAYMPANYKVIWAGVAPVYCQNYLTGQLTSEEVALPPEPCVVIQGKDNAGWTLEKYVAPRLGSGLMGCNEIDLSHPIMKLVPA